jgi:IclR family acetate operon transcriptional repressor
VSDTAVVSSIPLARVITNGSVKSPNRGSIQSVDRALSLLEALAEAGGEASLTDLSRRTHLNVSTCHHLLSTLVNWGYVAKVPGRRSYALGGRVLYLGHACLRQVDLPRRAQVHIDRISAVTGETVHLSVLQSDTIVTLLKRESRQAVRVDSGMIGRSDAPHATATGKAMIAWLPEEQVRRMVSADDMKRFTDKTIVDFDALIEELRQVRRNGYAIDREEYQPDVVCIGSAIRDHSGAVVGAISVSAPKMRATEAHLDLMRQEVMAAAKALSGDLGEPDSMLSGNGAMKQAKAS